MSVLLLGVGLGMWLSAPAEPESTVRVLTVSALARHAARETETEIYLAVLGHVFDVTAGGSYKNGGGYDFFTGLDGSAAFATGEFNEKGLVADIRGLSAEKATDVWEWLAFYQNEEKYPFVGVVADVYFDQYGRHTAAWHEMKALVDQGLAIKDDEKKLREEWPGCNMRTDQQGRKFWCSQQSGGIKRAWVGRPRAFFTNSNGKQKERCVCAPDEKLDDPRLRVYIGCDPTQDECVFPPEQKEI